MQSLPLWLQVYILSLVTLLGLVMGSFLNCAAWRACHGQSVTRGRSHCPACGHTLTAAELIPVFSWLFLRGRCRWCGAPVSWRYPATELLCGCAYLCAAVRFGLTMQALQAAAFFSLLLVLSLIDLETQELPDGLQLAAAGVWAAGLPFSPQPLQALKTGLLGGAAIAVPMLLLVLVMDRVLGRESMGGGDLKLVFVTGLYLGWARNLMMLVLACLLGLAAAAAGKKTHQPIPFGPAISGAAAIVLLWGQPLLDWYLQLFA